MMSASTFRLRFCDLLKQQAVFMRWFDAEGVNHG